MRLTIATNRNSDVVGIFFDADEFGRLLQCRVHCRGVSLIMWNPRVIASRTLMEVSVAGNKLQLDASIDVRTENKKGRGKKITGLHVRLL